MNRRMAAVTLASVFAVACSRESADAGSTDDEIKGVREYEITESTRVSFVKGGVRQGTGIGAPSKIGRALENLGLDNGTSKLKKAKIDGHQFTNDCFLPSQHHMGFSSKDVNFGATVVFGCKGETISSKKDVKGYLAVRKVPKDALREDAIYEVTASDLDELFTIATEPQLVGDLIDMRFVDGVSFASANDPASRETKDKSLVVDLVGALDLNQTLNVGASFPRCPTARTLTLFMDFNNKRSDKLFIELPCDGASGVVEAKFVRPASDSEPGLIPELVFGASIDSNVIANVEQSVAKSE